MSNRISQRARGAAVDPKTDPAMDGEYLTRCKTGAAKRLLIDIRELATAITARAGEMEAERRMPQDMVEVLKAIGAFCSCRTARAGWSSICRAASASSRRWRESTVPSAGPP